jgi:hypothetical protein
MATDIGSPSPGGAAADAMILRCPHPYPRTIRTGDEKGPLETDGASSAIGALAFRKSGYLW